MLGTQFTGECVRWPAVCGAYSQVFATKAYGNMLALDGVIQVTDRDEFSYQVPRVIA